MPELVRAINRRGNDPITPVVVRETIKRTAPINYLIERTGSSRASASRTRSSAATVRLGWRAHVLGYVTRSRPEQLKALQRKGYAAGDKIGEAGVEARTTST